MSTKDVYKIKHLEQIGEVNMKWNHKLKKFDVVETYYDESKVIYNETKEEVDNGND